MSILERFADFVSDLLGHLADRVEWLIHGLFALIVLLLQPWRWRTRKEQNDEFQEYPEDGVERTADLPSTDQVEWFIHNFFAFFAVVVQPWRWTWRK